MNPPTSSWRTDWLPSALFGVFSLLTSVTMFWLPVYFSEELGYSGAQIGSIFAFQALAFALASVPAGLGNDRIRSRTLALVALAAQSVFLLAMGYVKSFPAFLLVFSGWAFMYNTLRLTMEMQLLKHDAGDRTSNRIALFVAWRFGGIAVGMIMAAMLLTAFDFQWTFRVLAGVTLLLLIPALALPPTRVKRQAMKSYVRDLLTPRVILFIGWLFLFTTHWGVEQTCYGLFLRRNLGLNLQQMGGYMAAEFVAVIAVVLLVGRRLVDPKAPHLLIVVFALILSGVGHLGMIIDNPWISVLFRMIHGFGDGTIMVVLYLGVTRLFHVERLGGNAGVINLAMTAGMVAGAIVAAPAGEYFGYEHPIWISGVVLLLLGIPLVVRHVRSKANADSG